MSVIEDLLIKEEGYRQFPYRCTAGKLTIGIGFNLDDVGLSREESLMILQSRVEKLTTTLVKNYTWFEGLNEARQAAIISMVYQLGYHGFSKFVRTHEALDAGNYDKAAEYMLESQWAKQTPARAKRAATIMRTGQP